MMRTAVRAGHGFTRDSDHFFGGDTPGSFTAKIRVACVSLADDLLRLPEVKAFARPEKSPVAPDLPPL
jgi:hypothetical protein